MPRILLLVTDLEIGGTPTVVRELAIHLHKHFVGSRGNAIHVACLSEAGAVADQIKAAGIPMTALNARTARDIFVVARLNGLLREHGIDLVISFLIHANAIAAATALANPGVRYIQSIQTTQPNPRWHWRLQRLIHRMAEKIVVPSESVAEAAVQWSAIPRSKIVVISNAIDPTDYEDVQPLALEIRPFPIGFIGRLDPIKRIPDLLKAVRKLNGLVHLHVFGEGSERGLIERTIFELQIDHLVTMHGTIAKPPDALAQIGVLVLPSAAEGFGLVLIEAMAAGVPVIATNVSGIRDVVRHGQTGILVPVGSADDLANAISMLVKNSQMRNELNEQAILEVRNRFSWDQVFPQYLRLLDVIPTDPGRAAG